MGLKIDEISNIYASLLNAGRMERKPEIAVENIAGERDSYISAVSSDDLLQTTGDYDDQGQMDDDFSVNLSKENAELVSAAEFSREYTDQLMKTVAGSEAAGGEASQRE